MERDFRRTLEELRSSMGRLRDAAPTVMGGFGKLHKAATAPGQLDQKTKELIALGIAITVRCDGCIAFHVDDALKAGATHGEIAETIGVAVLMGGGPSVVYGCQAMDALEQLHPAVMGA